MTLEEKIEAQNKLFLRWVEFGVLVRNFLQLDLSSAAFGVSRAKIFKQATDLLNETDTLIRGEKETD